MKQMKEKTSSTQANRDKTQVGRLSKSPKALTALPERLMLRKSPIGAWRPDKVTAGEAESDQSLLVRLVCVLWCAVDLQRLWTEASLTLKGSCCLVRRKPERTEAENEMSCRDQKKKPRKKNKRQIPRRSESKRKEKREGTESSSKPTEACREAG